MPTLWMCYFGTSKDYTHIGWQCYGITVEHPPPTLTEDEQKTVEEFVNRIDPERTMQWKFTDQYLGPN